MPLYRRFEAVMLPEDRFFCRNPKTQWHKLIKERLEKLLKCVFFSFRLLLSFIGCYINEDASQNVTEFMKKLIFPK